jgi:gamma-glutamyltranspeptidase/glutathione hydrolase
MPAPFRWKTACLAPTGCILYTEASRLAFADRAQYLGDPDFVQPPGGNWMSLLDDKYLAERARLIGPQSMKTATPGNPGPVRTSHAPMPDQPEYGTSHISIVDAFGNAVAMTTTIEDVFGARQMVKGFLLNNELTDFSFAPADAQGKPIANRVQAGKRPRSSMAPTLVFDKATGELLMSGGSPGGALIIHYTAKTLYGVLNWGMTPQQAINLPNFGSSTAPACWKKSASRPPRWRRCARAAPRCASKNMTSGLQAITKGNAHGTPVWLGGADPRREGIVMGD